MLFSDTSQIDDLKTFLLDWFGSYRQDYGVPEREIPDYLPAALRELYLFAGRWMTDESASPETSTEPGPDIFQHQDYLYPVERCICSNGYIEFLSENQDNWTCRVKANDDLSPVFSDAHMLWDEAADDFEMCSSSLYHFLKTFCLQELVFGCKSLYAVCINTKGTDIDIKDLFQEPLEDIWLNGYYSQPYTEEPSHSFYRCGNVLIMDLYGELWIGHNTDTPLEELMAALPPSVYLQKIETGN